MTRPVEAARSFLFVPGDRPDRFDKARDSGADIVILDLEDAVADERKDKAREAVTAWLERGNTAVVRVNGRGTPWHEADVRATAHLSTALMLPKAELGEDVAAVRELAAADVRVIPLIETPAGVRRALELCSVNGTVRPALGNVDLSLALGVDPASHQALLGVRHALVLAAAEAGCGTPIDGVTTAVGQEELLTGDVLHGRELGMRAKLCIHPAQVPLVSELLAPTAGEVDWATSIVAAATDGVGSVDGHMVDRPVLQRARAILADQEDGHA